MGGVFYLAADKAFFEIQSFDFTGRTEFDGQVALDFIAAELFEDIAVDRSRESIKSQAWVIYFPFNQFGFIATTTYE